MAFIFNGNAPKRPMTEAEWRQAQASVAANRPTDLASGMGALAQAMMYRANRNGSFPAAPGGSALTGLFSLGARRGGGLY